LHRPGLYLAQQFHRNGALTGDDIRVVKGVYKGQALLLLQRGGMVVRVGVAVAEQHHLAAQAAHRVHLDLRRGGGHHDDRARAQFARR